MAKIQRLYDFQNGTRTDADQVDAEFDNLVKAHNDQDDELQKKVDETGDFKGTWNGREFEEADPFISSRVTAMENMVKEEEKVTVTLKRGENTIEAPEHAALVPVEILGDELKNIALDFDHWTLHQNVVKNSPDKVTLNAASAKEVSSLRREVKRNQDYVYSMKHTGAIAILDSIMGETPVVAYTDAQFIKFNSGNNSIIHLVFKNKNDEPGTFTFEGPMLIEGTVEREFVQNYQPVRGPYIEVDNGSGLYFDEYVYKGDKLYQMPNGEWRKKQNKIECELTADNVKNPTINSSYTGGKAIKIPVSEFAKGIDIYEVEVIKFNNTYFTRTDSAANITNNRYYLDNDSLILFVSASDTGWQDDPAPPAAGQPVPEPIPSKLEEMAFLLGWKMAHADGTTPYVDANKATKGEKKWIRIIGTGESLSLPQASYYGWKPLKIIYKTTTEQDVPAKYEGALRLEKGTNKVTLGEGIVLREKATPVLFEDKYYIGNPTVSGSETRHTIEKALAVFKQGKLDVWILSTEAQLDKALHDPLTFYNITYKVKDRFSFSCYIGVTEAKHTTNFHMESDDQVAQIEELRKSVSQLERVIIDKLGKKDGIPIIGKDGYPLTPEGVPVGQTRYKKFLWEVYTADKITLYPAHTATTSDKPNKYTKTIPLDGIVPKKINVYFRNMTSKSTSPSVTEQVNQRFQNRAYNYEIDVEEWLTTGRAWGIYPLAEYNSYHWYVQINKDVNPSASASNYGHGNSQAYPSTAVVLTKFYPTDPTFTGLFLELTHGGGTSTTQQDIAIQVEVEVWGI